jgi:hypothetical protein
MRAIGPHRSIPLLAEAGAAAAPDRERSRMSRKKIPAPDLIGCGTDFSDRGMRERKATVERIRFDPR